MDDSRLDDDTTPFEPSPAPRWVKRVIVAVVVLVLLVAALMIASGGNHGPGRHLSAPARSSTIAPR